MRLCTKTQYTGDSYYVRSINPEVLKRLTEHSVRFCGLKGRDAEAPWLCSNRVY